MPIKSIENKKSALVLGLMTGNSLDGADAVLLKITRSQSTKKQNPNKQTISGALEASKHETLHCKFIKHIHRPIPKRLRNRLMLLQKPKIALAQLSDTQFEFGYWLSEVFKNHFDPVDLIGVHGQTLYHSQTSSFQLIEAGFLADQFDCPVVYHFRGPDICLGGEGAPLSPFFHLNLAHYSLGLKQGLMKQQGTVRNKTLPQQKERLNSNPRLRLDEKISVHNLGGISNYTEIQGGKILKGFDTGPANMPIDGWVQFRSKGKFAFDNRGDLARQGRVQHQLVQIALTHPFFKRKPPKSCGKQEFGESWWKALLSSRLSLEDGAATLTEVVAQSIVEAYQKFSTPLPSQIYFCGGGAKNDFLLERIQSLFEVAKTKVETAKLTLSVSPQILTTETLGYPVETIEAAAFAFLAAARVWGIPLDLPAVTGAKRPALLGSILKL